MNRSFQLSQLLRNALGGMEHGPKPLKAALSFYAEQNDVSIRNFDEALLEAIVQGPNDPVRLLFNDHLKRWDWDSTPAWAGGIQQNTRERRVRIYALLRIDGALPETLDEYVPPYEGPGHVIIAPPGAQGDWYTQAFRLQHDFYWKQVRAFLKDVRHIPADSLNALDSATTEIVERIADPSASSLFGARGLIVGYVQSGKTTNFTGVIAKAIDAGYRLIIVLSGTTNLLRNQTQRRLDMDLVGVENILRDAREDEVTHDYKTDDDWPDRFIKFGARPSLLGRIDITRLTGQQDFRSPDVGLNPLEFEFEKRNKQLPLFHRDNLDHAGARIVVVKKQVHRLSSLLDDLTSVGRDRCSEIPTLVIDDESDQASVNTMNPSSPTDLGRKPINDRIVQILTKLPRAQYSGYTATPFANVFVDPSDPKDIYPRDFIVSLDRPKGYMGAREFVDLAPAAPGRLSNEKAFVRAIPRPPLEAGAADDNDRWMEAIDAFVLTGALKKYREKAGGPRFKHHTMLVHQSARKAHHEGTVQHIRKLWRRAAYDSPGVTTTRLKKLLQDFREVWVDRGKPLGLRFPRDFDQLKPALGAALADIRRGNPVIMVNSAEGAEVPNFDAKEGVWKIIVGGAKLSRGYTVEGLTVSYFRRSANMQDTLMQMGRWCGYRTGYEDLVRLYIGRAEPAGRTNTLDLYRAFEMMSRDEEDFRNQLAAYVKGSGITPRDVPALVFNTHPQLRPTARNRMFNAEMTWAGFTYREPLSQAVSEKGAKRNLELFDGLFRRRRRQTSSATVKIESSSRRFEFIWCKASNKEVLETLAKVAWDGAGSGIDAEIAYLGRREAQIDSWVVLAPQVGEDTGAGVWQLGGEDFRCILRTRFERRFGVFSSPEHVVLAKWLAGGPADGVQCPALSPQPRTGILLFYPTRIKAAPKKARAGRPATGFALVLPQGNPENQRVAFRVRNPSEPSSAVVSARTRG